MPLATATTVSSGLLSTLSLGLHFFFNDTPTTEIYTLSLHDALPICGSSSSPTRNRNSTTPSFEITPRTGAASTGSTKACAEGEIAPSSDGPSRRPATISPITGGCASQRWNAPPTRRVARVMSARLRSTCAKVLSPPAGWCSLALAGGSEGASVEPYDRIQR